jgi:cobyrinic acid a,c-diamide synthase
MLKDIEEIPKMVITALRGGSGKTILSLAIVAALRDREICVSPFKKGPDYIDAGWLALAAGRPCYNLDPHLIEKEILLESFQSHAANSGVAVIEGNRGLYDGSDLAGATSTAELAKMLRAPVLMCLDATKATRTLAALVQGCVGFDPEVMIRGVVLNRVAGARHEKSIRQSIEAFCKVPVLGAIPRLSRQDFPERHMGLVPTDEHSWAKDSVAAAADMARRYLDLDTILQLSGWSPQAAPKNASLPPNLDGIGTGREKTLEIADPARPVIGIIRDSAFQFYYPENIKALQTAGARTVFLSPLSQEDLPSLDGLYIGGGFPETHAARLAENRRFRDQLKQLATQGLPIYAECGGLMYLGESLVLEEGVFPMCGLLPIVFGFNQRPQGHGYTEVTVSGQNAFYPIGTRLKGHEFHYSSVLEWRGGDEDLAFTMTRGVGLIGDRDGACFRNVLATYTHVHALGTPEWAPALVRAALQNRRAHRS